MPLVDVSVNGRSYSLTCDAGQEDHLRSLADHVDKKVGAMLESVGQIGDARLMLMAALLATEEHLAAVQRLEVQAQAMVDLSRANDEMKARLADSEMLARDALKTATKRVQNVAAQLAAA